ncbi:coiled-coil domain-containing protein 68 [Rhincodon typus]|uniref:coiled-coil domain-containing protein 68 n=1 Tax=Rhincodon typus TaxID=259920 RepID=UPI0020306D29|nr:coiled-coil domain-containing protein 68 [Rhincodon typus]
MEEVLMANCLPLFHGYVRARVSLEKEYAVFTSTLDTFREIGHHGEDVHLTREKCEFRAPQVTYLCYRVDKSSLYPLEEKNAIQEAQVANADALSYFLLADTPPVVPTLEESILVANFLDTLPVTADNIWLWTQKHPVLTKVKQLVLEACQEAGAAALRNASQKLFENYQRQMDELRQRHDEEKHKLQTFAEEQEQSLKRSVENYNNLVLQLQQKQNRAKELEKLIERMEKEKKELMEKKQSLEKKMHWKRSTSMDVPDGSSRFQDLQLEVSTTHEKIFHLDSVVTQQHRNLYSVINTIENLKMKLTKQDQIILSLREQVGILEAENKELKYKAEVYSDKQNTNASPVSCASYESTRNKTPYQMLMKWKKESA